VKKTEPFLKQLKNDMATFLTTKQKAMKARSSMATLLTAYEEQNLTQYSDIDTNKLILTHGENGELKAAMEN